MEGKKRSFHDMMGSDSILTNGSRCPDCNLIMFNSNSITELSKSSQDNFLATICNCKDKLEFLNYDQQSITTEPNQTT
jgi:hypothetical protein